MWGTLSGRGSGRGAQSRMRGWKARPRDAGAAAVEFALVSMLLFVVLFGILQYGFGLWQLQQAQATTQDGAREAITGFASCAALDTLVDQAAGRNGLDGSAIQNVAMTFVDESGTAVSPDRTDYLRLTVTFAISDFNFPFVPFPDTIDRTSTVLLSDLGNQRTPCT